MSDEKSMIKKILLPILGLIVIPIALITFAIWGVYSALASIGEETIDFITGNKVPTGRNSIPDCPSPPRPPENRNV